MITHPSFSSYPNNPSGVKRNPLVMDPSRVVMDMVYYWPMYTDTEAKLDHPLMVFSRYIDLRMSSLEVVW